MLDMAVGDDKYSFEGIYCLLSIQRERRYYHVGHASSFRVGMEGDSKIMLTRIVDSKIVVAD